ncbi:hypothetical protein V5O48_014491, partial [Marasmius crinis-equi]
SRDFQNHGHLYHEEASINFLQKPTHHEQRLAPDAQLQEIHGRPIPPYHSLKRYQGLKTGALRLKWAFINPSARPAKLRNVPMFQCAGHINAYSLSMASAIIGPSPHFQRAILIGQVLNKKSSVYLAAQPDEGGLPFCIQVPTYAILPNFPPLHPKHLGFLALVSPRLAGIPLSKVGDHLHALTSCYPPVKDAEAEEREPEEARPIWADRWVGTPSLRRPINLGDWILAHSVSNDTIDMANAPDTRDCDPYSALPNFTSSVPQRSFSFPPFYPIPTEQGLANLQWRDIDPQQEDPIIREPTPFPQMSDNSTDLTPSTSADVNMLDNAMLLPPQLVYPSAQYTASAPALVPSWQNTITLPSIAGALRELTPPPTLLQRSLARIRTISGGKDKKKGKKVNRGGEMGSDYRT